MSAVSDPSVNLRIQRNCAVVVAVVMIIVSIGVVLPGVVRQSRELKAANAELVDLQGTIFSIQRRTRETQAAILRAQGEIAALQQHK